MANTIKRFDENSKKRIAEFDNLTNLTEGIIDTVYSSIGDWQDILGKDLEKVKLYKSLQEDYQREVSQGDNDKKLDDLKMQLEKLKSEIPSQLVNIDSKPIFAYEASREVIHFIYDAVNNYGEFVIVANVSSSSPEEYQKIYQLPIGHFVNLELSTSMHSNGIYVLLEDSKIIGELLNPFSDFGVHDYEFNKAFAEVFHLESVNDRCTAIFSEITKNDRNKMTLKIQL
ncbi:MAG: hypothetical protein U0V18_09140 [Anaerolineales bacterium]